MILLADSGSTKTHWAGVEHHEMVWERVTMGLNPRLTSDEEMVRVLVEVRDSLAQEAAAKIDCIYFYGAGCGTEEVCIRVSYLLQSVFGVVENEVQGDMLGACRAVCGTKPGFVGILGTGSNLCFYDGYVIARRRVSTGYLLGDEGSGNHIGRHLLKDYLEERMPKDISTIFHDTYPYTTEQFIDRIYRQPYPNRFLASLASFADTYQQEEYIKGVLDECFGLFFDQLGYFGDGAGWPLNLVGGITASFPDAIHRSALARNIDLGTLLPGPIQGLVHYHSNFA